MEMRTAECFEGPPASIPKCQLETLLVEPLPPFEMPQSTRPHKTNLRTMTFEESNRTRNSDCGAPGNGQLYKPHVWTVLYARLITDTIYI